MSYSGASRQVGPPIEQFDTHEARHTGHCYHGTRVLYCTESECTVQYTIQVMVLYSYCIAAHRHRYMINADQYSTDVMVHAPRTVVRIVQIERSSSTPCVGYGRARPGQVGSRAGPHYDI